MNGASGRAGQDDKIRPWLAIFIVSLSIIGIAAASLVAIALATDMDRPEMARLVFAAVLPLFGTWVGTVLAFYFARENLQAATESTIRLTGRLEPRTPVRQVMIPKGQIVAYTLGAGGDAGATKLSDLYERMKSSGRQRLPILDASGSALYVVHLSSIAAFADSVDADPAHLTQALADLLTHADFKTAIEAIGVVGPDAVIADARAAMRAVERCNDVFVTTDGKRPSPVIGWLTNTDLAGLE